MEFNCECGQPFKAEADWAGRRAACNSCGKVFEIPHGLDDVPESPPVLMATAVSSPVVPINSSMRNDLEQVNRRTSSAASNPGMLRVSYWRYALGFPKWVAIWHGLALVLLLLAIVHWAFGVASILAAGICVLYWRGVRAHFIGGCVNPAIVHSLSPPTIAVSTNLTRTGEDWTCVKVLPQKLARMSSGGASVSQKLATVAVYQGMDSGQSHWDDFFPVVADIVTADQSEITRLMMAIQPDDWSELVDCLQQLPQPIQPGLYRIYPQACFSDSDQPVDETRVAACLRTGLEGLAKNKVYLAEEAAQDDVEQVILKIGRSPAESLVAFLGGAGKGDGMLLTSAGGYYHFRETGSGVFTWQDVVGAFAVDGCFEITLRSGERLRIPARHFLNPSTTTTVERVVNQVTDAG